MKSRLLRTLHGAPGASAACADPAAERRLRQEQHPGLERAHPRVPTHARGASDRPANAWPRTASTSALLTCISLGLWSWACQDGTDGGGDASDDTEPGEIDVLRSVADQVIVPATAQFATDASALDAAAAAHLAAVGDATQGPIALDEARAAWRAAYRTWQQLEVMSVGPAAVVTLPGGEGIRDAIYSWPTVNTCAIDRAVAEEEYLDPEFIADSYVYAYGLDALEYLLFERGAAHTCPPQIQLDPLWDALTPEQREARRSAYAVVLTAALEDRAGSLAARWGAEGFADLFAEPGAGNSPYTGQQNAKDQLFRAMFYVELSTKDGKLGVPIGIVDGCAAVPCIASMESPYADQALPAISANLAALRLILQGGPDPESADGFDDLLAEAGHPEVGAQILADIDAAIALIDSIDVPLQQLAVTDSAQTEAIYAAVKKVTDTLKGPIPMILNLQVPSEGAGDAD